MISSTRVGMSEPLMGGTPGMLSSVWTSLRFFPAVVSSRVGKCKKKARQAAPEVMK